jgi:hypothetical protein
MLLAGGKKQADVNLSLVHNSTDRDMWKKVSYLDLSTCNDGDVLEWCMGYKIPIIFKQHFWPIERMNPIHHDDGKPF